MVRFRWTVTECPWTLWQTVKRRTAYIRLCFRSLFCNEYLRQNPTSYAADVCLEPVFYLAMCTAGYLGRILVLGVIILISFVVYIAYWIGLPYWWALNRPVTVFLVIFGNWLLLNVAFHFYMGVTTSPGEVPAGRMIASASSICKKCIAPKPARVHHCSVCNKCYLKMDHHCPWMNNCVGFRNHRFFYLFMVYTIAGCLFVMIFGSGIAYDTYFGKDAGPVLGNWFQSDIDVLEGHPVRVNGTGHMVPVLDIVHYDEALGILPREHEDLPLPEGVEVGDKKKNKGDKKRKKKKPMREVVFGMALLLVPVCIALTVLSVWHGRLITRGETCIEACVNKTERKKCLELGKVYKNPYDFGPRRNWQLFLGLVDGRTIWRHILWPSTHKPPGDGIIWETNS